MNNELKMRYYMKIIKFVFIFIIFSCIYLPAQTIDLEQARVLALANSRSLAKYELAIRSSILDERNQLYTMLPVVSAGYSASVNYLHDFEFVNPVDTFTSGADFSITQVFFQGGKGFIQKALSAISTESTRKDALAEYFYVLDSVDNAYYAALEADAIFKAEESSLEAAELSFSIAEVRHSHGIINPGDYLKALADRETREHSYNQARRNINLNMSRLRSVIGINSTFELEQINFDIYENVIQRLALISDNEANVLYNEFWELLLAANPSLAKAALNSQRAEGNLTLAKRDFSPVLSATLFSTGLSYSTANGFNTTGTGGVSIKGSIPVDFWVLSNRIEKSSIARDSAVLDYISAEISLETELQSAFLNMLGQAGSVLSSGRSLDYTEKHFEFIMERYRLSLSSVSDLNEASSLLIISRNNHIKAKYGFLQSLSKLRSLCALGDEDKLLGILLGN
jgi:outer membrane protein TolC